MLLEKDYAVKATPAELLALLTDTERAARCVPNMQSFERIGEKKLKLIVAPKFTFLQTRITMEWELLSADMSGGKLAISGRGIGSSFGAQVTLRMQPASQGSSLHLSLDITTGGLLKQVPQSVILGGAGNLADELIVGFHAAVRG